LTPYIHLFLVCQWPYRASCIRGF